MRREKYQEEEKVFLSILNNKVRSIKWRLERKKIRKESNRKIKRVGPDLNENEKENENKMRIFQHRKEEQS